MERRTLGIIIICILAVAIFGVIQYMLVTQEGTITIESNIRNKNEMSSDYDIKVWLENPSLLVLSAGQTEFKVVGDGRTIGQGSLEAFTLNPLDEIAVLGTYTAKVSTQEIESVQIVGTIRYDMGVAAIEVPFTYNPTDEQVMEFIPQN